MRIALDSNVMIYAEGAEDDLRRHTALKLIGAIKASDLLIPLQALGETLRWLVGRGGLSKQEAIERSELWTRKYPVQETNGEVFESACELISHHAFQVWDAVIVSAASVGGASVLLSEDMHDGFKWRSTTILNPFAPVPSSVVRELLNSRP